MPANTHYSECTAVIVEMRPVRSWWTENGRTQAPGISTCGQRAPWSRCEPSPAGSRPGASAAPPPPARRRSWPARSQWSPSTPAPPRWLDFWHWSRRHWCSTPVTGWAWPLAAVLALSLRLRFDERSAGWRRRGGGYVTRSSGVGVGISTAWRSPRPGSRSRSFSAPALVVVSALRCAICSGGPRVLCPGVRPPALLHLRGGFQSSAGGVAGR